jgi:hypothetical protein
VKLEAKNFKERLENGKQIYESRLYGKTHSANKMFDIYEQVVVHEAYSVGMNSSVPLGHKKPLM